MKRQTEITFEYGGWLEGYKCECGWTAGFYEGVTVYGLPIPTMMFYNCCKQCGNPMSKIEIVTGRYLFKRIPTWFGFKSKLERIKFVPREENEKSK